MRRGESVTWELALASMRQRWVSFLGAFFALVLGTTIIAAGILTLAATIGTPHPEPQRFAAAQTVIVPSDGEG